MLAHNKATITTENDKIIFFDSAIKFFNQTTKNWQLVKGTRHCEIIKKIADAGFTEDYKNSHIDGFLCIWNGYIQFIDRGTATNFAKAANYPMTGSVLTSEDLW